VWSNYAKARWGEWATLPRGTDALVVVLFQSTGLPSDATFKNVQYLSDAIAAGAVEATFSGYSRKTVTGYGTNITLSVNTGTGVVTLDIPDQAWSPAGGSTNNTLGAIWIGYQPTSTSPDSAIRQVSKHDFSGPANGGTLTATIPSIGTAQ
jgi:hypothetical protein